MTRRWEGGRRSVVGEGMGKRITSFINSVLVHTHHAVLVVPHVARHMCPVCAVVPSLPACWLLSFRISLFSILHPSIQQALTEHLVYTVFLFMSPGQGH